MNTRTSKSLAIWAPAIALMVAIASLALAGCGSDTNDSSTALTLTASDQGKSFTVSVGDTITVTLEGNPTTGYAWESDMPETDPSLLTLVGGQPQYTQEETGSDVTGAGGTYTFEFQAVAAGQVELKLKYWRSFEPQAQPLETFNVQLTIE